jgi:hypothetical protein
LGLYGRVNHETLEKYGPHPFPPLYLLVIGRSYPELTTFCNLYSVMSFSHGQSDHLSGYDLMIWRCVTVREVTAVRLDSFVLYALAASSFLLCLCPNQMSLIRKDWIDRLFYQLRCRTGNECRNSGRFLMPRKGWGSRKAGWRTELSHAFMFIFRNSFADVRH